MLPIAALPPKEVLEHRIQIYEKALNDLPAHTVALRVGYQTMLSGMKKSIESNNLVMQVLSQGDEPHRSSSTPTAEFHSGLAFVIHPKRFSVELIPTRTMVPPSEEKCLPEKRHIWSGST